MPFDMYSDVILTADVTERGCVPATLARWVERHVRCHRRRYSVEFFDMTGNTWEWTTDIYAPRHAVPGGAPVDAGTRANLLAPAPAADLRRVLKGGSHLCSPDYCLRYRPAARQRQTVDTSTSHLGFRCIIRV